MPDIGTYYHRLTHSTFPLLQSVMEKLFKYFKATNYLFLIRKIHPRQCMQYVRT
ncbi:hypothetical protein PFDG_05263 [Plasmodium falciparum Dd2]|uniref:Uncharacterized protein n=1 Tax=Plasmodium falciparum (isolate Dd2) TaxID=57267 RepID=A0A0L7MAT6_PLAF4|nr:hypothetical protein PFDG_05263 [Plasmodium falciparum Dd2]